jgi:hypothetical protein
MMKYFCSGAAGRFARRNPSDILAAKSPAFGIFCELCTKTAQGSLTFHTSMRYLFWI